MCRREKKRGGIPPEFREEEKKWEEIGRDRGKSSKHFNSVSVG